MLLPISFEADIHQVAELLGSKAQGANQKSKPLQFITSDSREVKLGTIFVAYRGVEVDGHKYIESAVKKGASLIIAEDESALLADAHAIIVPDGRYAHSALSAWATENPSEQLETVGITGTNGKTTTLWLVTKLLESFDRSVLHLGTLGIHHGKNLQLTGEMTTPPADRIHNACREALEHGATSCVMEVTSHGLDQKRTAHVTFDAVVFTNLSPDHLHYHNSMEDYFLAKRLLFEQAVTRQPSTPCIVNVDDMYGKKLAEWCKAKAQNYITFGFDPAADVRILEQDLRRDGATATLRESSKSFQIYTPLIGEYNLLNAVAAYLTLCALGYDAKKVREALSSIDAPVGRMEKFIHNGAEIYVDYAHTAEGLEKALQALRPLTSGDLWVIFGAGGSKDPRKRSGMGAVARECADKTVITADNPKTVPLEEINRDILSSGLKPTFIEDDRAKAIQQAIQQMKNGDTLLIAGKGQEDYQFIGTETIPYTDQGAVQDAIRSLTEGESP